MKKSAGPLFAQPGLTDPCIAEQAKLSPVRPLSRVLDVSVSGYADWLTREPSAHEREEGEWAKARHRLFQAFRGVSGRPRVHAE
jgi:hypothetical protein